VSNALNWKKEKTTQI